MADALTDALHATRSFMNPAYRSALGHLRLPNGSAGLDIGCGVGNIWPVVAEVVGAETRLSALDPSQHCVAEAHKEVDSSDFETPVQLHHTDLESFAATPAQRFDWVWSADVLWPTYFADVAAGFKSCAELLKPGGTLAFFTANYYRSVFLAGYARLESLVLLASQQAWGVELAGNPNYYENARSWFQEAGLTDITLTLHPMVYTASDFAEREDVRAYLERVVFPDYRRAAAAHGASVGLSQTDQELLARLTDPDSHDYLLRRSGYYGYHVGILVSGKTPLEEQ